MRARISIAAVVVMIGLLLTLIRLSDSPAGPSTEPAPPPATAATPSPSLPAPSHLAPTEPAASLDGRLVVRDRWWKPGQEHDYGNDVDPFIRQPQDYDGNTPAILGERISFHVYDLERVQDMVRRGIEPGSELAQVRGSPVSARERDDARQVLQAFFDATVADVDAVIEGSLSRDEGYALIGPRRLALDRDLRGALGLSEKQFYDLWPHIGDRDRIRHTLRD